MPDVESGEEFRENRSEENRESVLFHNKQQVVQAFYLFS